MLVVSTNSQQFLQVLWCRTTLVLPLTLLLHVDVGVVPFKIDWFARGLSGCIRGVMSSAAPLLLRLLSASVCSANKAGVLIREVLKSGNLGIVEKVAFAPLEITPSLQLCRRMARPFLCFSHCLQGGNDPQTEADRRAQKCIVTTLETRFPGLCIVGEENVAVNNDDGKLVAEGECEEVVKEQCPMEYGNVDLKDVSNGVGERGREGMRYDMPRGVVGDFCRW